MCLMFPIGPKSFYHKQLLPLNLQYSIHVYSIDQCCFYSVSVISVCVALLTPADTYKLNMPQVVCNALTCVVRRSHLSVYYSGEKEDCRVEYDAVKVV